MTDTATKPYTIVGTPIHQVQWSEELQENVPGWLVRGRWNKTGTIIPVFVPDTADLPSTADTLIRAQGAQIDTLHA